MRFPLAAIPLLIIGCSTPTDPEGEEAPFPPEDSELATDSAELLGESCTPVACSVTQCGMVPDGCRSEMWCGDCSCPSGAMSCERQVNAVFELTLKPDASAHTIYTTGLSFGADPVIHVLNGSSEIAFDDNSGGGTNASVTFNQTLSQTLVVVVRAKSAATTGTGQLVIDGVAQPITIGGTFQTFTNLRAQEQIESIKLFGNVADRHVIYALAADGLHISGRVSGNGTASGAVWTQATAIASRSFVFGVANAASSPANVIRNDVAISGHDADLDGLGSELEAAIGTCRTRTETAIGPDSVAFYCGNTQDARDTDGDGLSDADELRGARDTFPHLPLRLWGATPRHKDMFVEIDASQLVAGGPALRLSPTDARRFSDYYGDRTSVLPPATALAHAQTLKNPDGKPGVRTHLDIGVAPETPADAKVYGDWGGWSVVPPAPGGGGQAPNSAFQSHMASGRHGRFRYGLWYEGGGGSTSTSVPCLGCGSYGWSSGNEIDTFTHESAHAHGLAHSGPAKDGVSDPADPNCKASYPSIVNYAFTGAGTGFSDGTGVTGINNVAAREWQAVPSLSNKILATLQNGFGYKVDFAAGHVDWNRDGSFAPSGATVRSYTNYQPGNACEFTRYNQMMLPTASNTTLAPAIGRWDSWTFVFSGGANPLRYTTTTSSLNCPQPTTSACGSWGSTTTLSIDATRGVDATRVTTNGQDVLLVVTVNAAGMPQFAVLKAGLWGIPQWSAIGPVPGTVAASSEPSLTTMPDGSALLVYRRSDGYIAQATYVQSSGPSGVWTSRGVAANELGVAIAQAAQAAPGLARANFTGHGDSTYGLFATGADAVLGLRKLNTTTWRWMPDLPLDDSMFWWRSVTGRPVGVWVPDASSAQGGRMYIYTTSRDGIGDGTGRGLIMRWSYISNGQLRIGLTSGYDSWWTYSRGVDAWYEPGRDTNVRAAWSISPLTNTSLDSQIRFDPKADGLNDYVQSDNNDWVQIGYAVCKALVNPTGTATNPINCGPRSW